MIERLSSLERCDVGRFQLVIPLGLLVGVADQTERRFVLESDRLAVHRHLVLRQKTFGKISENRLTERQPAKGVPCRAERKLDAGYRPPE